MFKSSGLWYDWDVCRDPLALSRKLFLAWTWLDLKVNDLDMADKYGISLTNITKNIAIWTPRESTHHQNHFVESSILWPSFQSLTYLKDILIKLAFWHSLNLQKWNCTRVGKKWYSDTHMVIAACWKRHYSCVSAVNSDVLGGFFQQRQ